MTSTQRHAFRFVLTSLCLLCFGGVGISATEVGGSGGYGTSGYRYSIGACNTTTRTTRVTTSQQYNAHVQIDMADGQYSLGAESGLNVTGDTLSAVSTTTETDEVTGEEFTWVSGTDRAFASDWRVHLIPRAGIHRPFVDFVGGVGFSWGVGPNPEYALLPAFDYEIRLGQLGLVSYYGRGQFLGLKPNDFSVTNGASFLGGDLPAVHLGLRIAFHEALLLTPPIPLAEVGFASPRHWPVRFGVNAALGRSPTLADRLSWDVRGEVALVLGKRPKQSLLPMHDRIVEDEVRDLEW